MAYVGVVSSKWKLTARHPSVNAHHIETMTYSLRSLMLMAMVGPPLLSGLFILLREVSLAMAALGVGIALLVLFAAYDFARGV